MVSPIVLAPKADGSRRFAIDFKKLNAVTRKEKYLTVSHIKECLDLQAELQSDEIGSPLQDFNYFGLVDYCIVKF